MLLICSSIFGNFDEYFNFDTHKKFGMKCEILIYYATKYSRLCQKYWNKLKAFNSYLNHLEKGTVPANYHVKLPTVQFANEDVSTDFDKYKVDFLHAANLDFFQKIVDSQLKDLLYLKNASNTFKNAINNADSHNINEINKKREIQNYKAKQSKINEKLEPPLDFVNNIKLFNNNDIIADQFNFDNYQKDFYISNVNKSKIDINNINKIETMIANLKMELNANKIDNDISIETDSIFEESKANDLIQKIDNYNNNNSQQIDNNPNDNHNTQNSNGLISNSNGLVQSNLQKAPSASQTTNNNYNNNNYDNSATTKNKNKTKTNTNKTNNTNHSKKSSDETKNAEKSNDETNNTKVNKKKINKNKLEIDSNESNSTNSKNNTYNDPISNSNSNNNNNSNNNHNNRSDSYKSNQSNLSNTAKLNESDSDSDTSNLSKLSNTAVIRNKHSKFDMSLTPTATYSNFNTNNAITTENSNISSSNITKTIKSKNKRLDSITNKIYNRNIDKNKNNNNKNKLDNDDIVAIPNGGQFKLKPGALKISRINLPLNKRRRRNSSNNNNNNNNNFDNNNIDNSSYNDNDTISSKALSGLTGKDLMYFNKDGNIIKKLQIMNGKIKAFSDGDESTSNQANFRN